MILKYGLLLVAYLLGSIPFSVIIGKKFKGIDVREHGSGNPGGTNSIRWLGRNLGLTIMFLDGLKAGLIVLLVQLGVFDSLATELGVTMLHPLAYGTAAAFGHVFSAYINFKGGKAVASTVGIMVAYYFPYAIVMFIVFMLTLKKWRYVSVSSTCGVFTMILLAIFVEGLYFDSWEMLPYSVFLFLLVAIRHRSNFQKIKLGTESRSKLFSKKDESTN